MKLRRLFQSPETKRRQADEKRRRLSFLKGKHQADYKPSEARAPKPRQTLKRTVRTARTILTRVSKQAKKMPSGREMEKFVWGSGEQKKKG